MLYGADKRASMENKRFIIFSISADSYSIEDFNAEIKASVLQEQQDWIQP